MAESKRNKFILLSLVGLIVVGVGIAFLPPVRDALNWRDPTRDRQQKKKWHDDQRVLLAKGDRNDLVAAFELENSLWTPSWQKGSLRRLIVEVLEVPAEITTWRRRPEMEDRWRDDHWDAIEEWLTRDINLLIFDDEAGRYRLPSQQGRSSE